MNKPISRFSPRMWLVCKYCGRAFQIPNALIEHKNVYHPEEFRKDKENRKNEAKHSVVEEGSVSSLSTTQDEDDRATNIKKIRQFLEEEMKQGQEAAAKSTPPSCSDKTDTSEDALTSNPLTALQAPTEAENGNVEVERTDQEVQTSINEHTDPQTKAPTETNKRRNGIRSRRSVKKQSYQCQLCLKIFRDRNSLKFHLVREHKGADPFECKVCKTEFDTHKECVAHVLSHSENICKHCNQLFTEIMELQNHVPACKANPNPPGLSTSVENSPSEKVPKKQRSKKSNLKSQTKALGRKCPNCQKAFRSAVGLYQHRKAEDCSKMVNKSLSCFKCGKEFSEAAELKGHEDTHLQKEPGTSDDLVCPYCDKTFKKGAWRLKHMKICHPREYAHSTQFRETFAARIAKSRSKLSQQRETADLGTSSDHLAPSLNELSKADESTEHEKTTEEDPKRCTICDKTFNTLRSRRIHERVHSRNGNKPFKCTRCPQTFSRQGCLTRHNRDVHEILPFQCTFCPTTLVSRFSLVMHLAMEHSTNNVVRKSTEVDSLEESPKVNAVRKSTGVISPKKSIEVNVVNSKAKNRSKTTSRKSTATGGSDRRKPLLVSLVRTSAKQPSAVKKSTGRSSQKKSRYKVGHPRAKSRTKAAARKSSGGLAPRQSAVVNIVHPQTRMNDSEDKKGLSLQSTSESQPKSFTRPGIPATPVVEPETEKGRGRMVGEVIRPELGSGLLHYSCCLCQKVFWYLEEGHTHAKNVHGCHDS